MNSHLRLRPIGVRVFLAGACLLASALSVPAAEPLFLPKPKRITLSSGQMTLGPAPAIVVSNESLKPLGEVLANDIVTLYRSTRPTVAVGDAKEGGIFLKLARGNPKYKSIDAYTLQIGSTATVEGGSYQAIAFGMMTLVQALHGEGKGLALPKLQIQDDADRPFRALQLDIRVGYHPPEYIKKGIDMMRFYKVRVLQLHTSEPLWVGAAFPSSNGATDLNDLRANFGWTKKEMDDVIEYARVRGVLLIPHNEMRPNDPYWRATLLVDFNKSDKFAGYVDEADGKGAYQWPAGDNLAGDKRFWNFVKVATQRSYDQFAKGWPGGKLPFYHIGPVYGEGGCNGREAVRMLTYLKERNPNIKMMFWNGPGPGDPDLSPHKKNIVVDFYSKQWGGDPAGMLKAGWELCNTSWTPLYILQGSVQKAIAQGKWIYDEFSVTRFGKESGFGEPIGPNADDCRQYAGKIMGSLLSTWDFPGPGGHLEVVLPCIPYYAEHAWNMKPWPYPKGSYEKAKRAFDALGPVATVFTFHNGIRLPAKEQAIIAWDAARDIAGDSDVSLEGTLVRAVGGAPAATVNGVAFQNALAGVESYVHKEGGKEYTCYQGAASAADSFRFHRAFEPVEWGVCLLPSVFGSGNAPFAALSPDYKALLGGGVTVGAGTATLTLGKLTKGQAYLVQVWVNDSRGSGAQQTVDGAVVMKYNVQRAEGGLGQYVIGRFTATGPTQSFTIEGEGSGGPESVNAYQLRAIGAQHPATRGR